MRWRFYQSCFHECKRNAKKDHYLFFFFKRKPVITTVTILQLAFRARKQHIVGPQKKKKKKNKKKRKNKSEKKKINGCHYFVLYFFFFWNSSSVVWCAQHKLINCLFVFFCLSFGFTAINVFCYFSAIQQRTLRKEQFAEKKKTLHITMDIWTDGWGALTVHA